MMREFLEAHRGSIVNQWLSYVEGSPFTQGLSRDEIVDCLPDYLTCLSRAFAVKDADSCVAADRARILEAHITTRLSQGFNVDDVVREYLLLGEAVSRVLAGAGPTQAPDGVEVDRFYGLLNAAVSTAVTGFGRHLLEDEQNEKRHLRLLDDLATAALGEGAPLEGRLEEIVRIVERALDAETVTLLLFDPSTKGFSPIGRSDGAHAVPVEPRLDSERLVARAAATRDSFSPGDEAAENGDAGVPAPCNGCSSRKAMLAHRLWFKGELIGVLCAELPTSRRFGVTERRRLRALAEHLALLIANARLFQQVRETVSRLETEQALRERFVAVLAHDLRGPLSVAKLSAQTLLRVPGASKEVHEDLVLKIDRNLDRTERMVRDLLDTNRVRAGEELPVQLGECDLGNIAREVADEVGPERDRVVVDVEPGVRGVWDEEQLRRALWNLVTNALKYGAPGTRITVSIRRENDRVVMSVHNEGACLSSDDQARLFQPFRRGASAYTSGMRGWGLGLTLVRGSAAALGGDVTVKSEVGEGTTFSLTLPWDSRCARR
jgi:signal transduction histidine kinase